LVRRAEARDCGGEPGAWHIADHGARRYNISSGLLYTWLRHLLEGSLGISARPVANFARVAAGTKFLACPSSYSAWPPLGKAGDTIMKRRLIMV
jgi:transposase-like protein